MNGYWVFWNEHLQKFAEQLNPVEYFYPQMKIKTLGLFKYWKGYNGRYVGEEEGEARPRCSRN